MTTKNYGKIGISVPILFWSTYIIMSSIRPEYSMFTKAISELGSVDAPRKWIWNFFGYFLPGVLITVYSVGLYNNMATQESGKWPLYGIFLSGFFMALSGIFPGDFDNPESITMILHIAVSFGSYLFFLVGAFTFSKDMDKLDYWKSTKKPTLIFTYLTILFGTWVFIFPDIPAFGQRIVFFFYFLWIFYTATKLHNRNNNISVSNSATEKSSHEL